MSDSLATLRQALNPRRGMRRLPLTLESNGHPSRPFSAKSLVNLHAEAGPPDARSQAALISAPGLQTYTTIGAGPHLAMNFDMPGMLYTVSGDHFFRHQFPTTTDMGAVGTVALDGRGNDTFSVTIAISPIGVVVCVPPNCYTATHAGAVVNQITGTFPGANSVAYLNGYFIFTSTTHDSRFFVSYLLDPTMFAALDFAYADGLAGELYRAETHRGECWMIGENASQIWYVSGDADFPMRPRDGGTINFGATGPRGITVGDNSIWMLTPDCSVLRSAGYKMERISTHAIEDAIKAAGIVGTEGMVNLLCSMFFTIRGHSFYVVTVGARTFAYDVATKLWAERSSSTDGNDRWRPRSAATNTNVPLIGDGPSGKLFFPTYADDKEDGASVIHRMVSPPLWGGTHRVSMHRFEAEMEVGDTLGPGNVTLDWSDDGGWSFTGGPRTLNAGSAGERGKRVFTTRLGSFRQRDLRLTTVGKTTIYAVDHHSDNPDSIDDG